MKAIIVSGTPGTGKTRVAKKIAKEIRGRYVDVNKVVQKYRLAEGCDKKRKTKVVDIKKLNRVLTKMIREIKKTLVIDSHLSHYLPKEHVRMAVICKCEVKELRKRLKKRGYGKEKIEENVEAEIMDVCLNEARELGHKIKIVKPSKKSSSNRA
ncbi:MAG: AAA family ATPase [archaeon]